MGLLGAMKDEQFRGDVCRGLLDAANRGGVAGLLGAPVDMTTMAIRPLGYTHPMPVMGSDWIAQQMEKAGLVGKQKNAIAEVLASLAFPALMPSQASKATLSRK